MSESDNDDFSMVTYRPRYAAEESSDAAFEKDEQYRRCLGRKRRAVTILLMGAFFVVFGVVARVYLFFTGLRGRLSGNIKMLTNDDYLMRNESSRFSRSTSSSSGSLLGSWKKQLRPTTIRYKRAAHDSIGFFNTISDDDWAGIKQQAKSIIDDQDGIMMRTSYLLSEGGANINSHVWWVDNWKINLSCPNKALIGGKWICDPMRVITAADKKHRPKKKWGQQNGGGKGETKECLVYISGRNDMEFGHQFLDYSVARMIELHDFGQVGVDYLGCQVHIFTPNGQEIPEQQQNGLFVHNWGFRPSNKLSMGFAAENSTAIAFKTLEETIYELGHSGRISMLIVDCEGCEWDFYSDIIALEEPIPQVLMQMHGTPYMANELFLAMQEAGYLISHREAEQSGNGEVWDYSWLKLAPSFFTWK